MERSWGQGTGFFLGRILFHFAQVQADFRPWRNGQKGIESGISKPYERRLLSKLYSISRYLSVSMNILLRTRTLFKALTLSVLAVLLAGCPAVVSLDYVPSNQFKGQGKVQVNSFEYLYRGVQSGPAQFRPKEIESDTEDIERLYLSQDIGLFFTDALKKELTFSGYQVIPAHDLVIAGVVERFAVDWIEADQIFELNVSYQVTRNGQHLRAFSCRSKQQKPAQLVTSGAIIRAGIKDCIEQFLQGAQEAKVL